MDHSLSSQVIDSARNLLATSHQFEPFIPKSQQNVFHALHFLEGLANITQKSLEEKLSKTPVQEQKINQPATPPQPSQAPTPTSSPSPSHEQLLLEALIRTRNSRRSFNRVPGTISPIFLSKKL